jgi:hypothetical protein
MTNGLHHYFWEVGIAHPRMVSGFFTADDLRRLKFIRENKKPLKDTPINKSIVDRSYQHEAIRRVGEAFDAGRRRALLVMATGTGKTRTTMGPPPASCRKRAEPRPILSTIRTSSARDFACILRITLPRWTFTVISLTSRSPAICLFKRPVTTRAITSLSI